MQRKRSVSRALACLTAVLGAAIGVVASSPPASAGSASITDGTGDNNPDRDPRGDITSASATYSADAVAFRVTTATTEAPTSPNWVNNATGADWSLDTTGDGEPDYFVVYATDLDSMVHVSVIRLDGFTLACEGSAGYDTSGYTATFPKGCIGGPASFSWSVDFQYETDSGLSSDTAPDSGPTGPVLGDRRPVGAVDTAVRSPGMVEIGGWAADPDTPTTPLQVHLYLDATFVTAVTADASRPDVGAAFPAFGANHGYSAAVPVTTGGTHRACAYGIGNEAGGNALLGCRTVPTSPFGAFDSVQRVPGGLQLSGWAIDPDVADPIDVHVYLDGGFVTGLTANGERADVGAAHPGYGTAHGFSGTIPVTSGGAHVVCVYAINGGPGSNAFLRCRLVVVGVNPFGRVDAARRAPGGIRVTGWAFDADATGAITVHAYVDGAFATSFSANVGRADVGAAFPGYGDNHGFDAVVPITAPGRHVVCLYGINVGPGGNSPVRCHVLAVRTSPFGHLDSVAASGTITGWAIDPDVADPITVHVYMDGRFATSATADQPRPDVGAAFPGYGDDHGLSAPLPPFPLGRPVVVCAYAINAGAASPNTLLGCRTVT